MSIAATLLAAGPGWRISDVVCAAGPGDRPFEERHEGVAVAAVLAGVFAYRSSHGSALLAPGAVLLGNAGACYRCGHDHSAGDRCLSLQFDPAYWERLVAALPGLRRATFARAALPPLERLAPAFAALEAARARGDLCEEDAILFAEAALGAERAPGAREPGVRSARLVCDAVRRLETAVAAGEPAPALAALAAELGADRFRLLRSFRAAIGVTPHHYALRLRLGRAARRLAAGDEPVTTIAFDSGFGDLSTFHRRFRRVMGATPRAWRAARRRA